jgi:hypothetical protein
MNRRQTQTSPRMAKVFVEALVGDGEWETPSGTPAYSLFAVMDLESAHRAYEQIHALPEGDRLRDIMERLGEDGRVAG